MSILDINNLLHKDDKTGEKYGVYNFDINLD